jgi:hypothetical protein
MLVNTITTDGKTRFTWDSETGVTEYEADGTTVIFTRPFTPAEQAYASSVMSTIIQTNTEDLYQVARDSILKLLDGITTVQSLADGTLGTDVDINANPAPYIKGIAIELVEIETTVIALARLVAGQMDSNNVG